MINNMLECFLLVTVHGEYIQKWEQSGGHYVIQTGMGTETGSKNKTLMLIMFQH